MAMAILGGFSDRVQQLFSAARRASVRMNAPFVGSEHILIALLESARGDAPGLPENIIPETVTEAIKQISMAQEKTQIIRLEFTPRGKKVLENSIRESHVMGHAFVMPGHVWLALLDDPENTASRILSSMGCKIDELRESIRQKAAETPQPEASAVSFPISGGRIPIMNMNMGNPGATNEDPLKKYARDLTAAAKKGELDPVVGRERETERVMQILLRRTKNNPVLVGEPGVGKSAVAEGLAQLIADEKTPDSLKGKRLLALDMSAIVAGSKFRGEFEERFKSILDAAKKDKNVILFIDEMQSIVGAGKADGALDAASILKPALARGEMQCIGATTLDDYRKSIEKDTALARRFQPVTVSEPDEHETLAILNGLREKYEQHHQVVLPDSVLACAVRLSGRYIPDRFQPDKAIDLIDEAASRVRMAHYKQGDEAKEDEDRPQVTEEDLAAVVSGWTGIPVSRMTEKESERLMHLEETLHKRLIGQDEAVAAVSRAIRRARSGLKDPRRPIGSFIFLGPTGVGKTELCRALGEAMFGDEDALIRLDMSEYMEKHTVSRMVGSPPGYVGFEEGGQLTEAVRRKPYSVVLFDEIEKAHPDVFNMLLQILEDGRLTDSFGRTVSFRNCVIVMTSNAGAVSAQRGGMGFGSSGTPTQENYERMREKVLEEVKRLFKPEFVNRVDELIVFHKLSTEDITRIAGIMLREVGKRLNELGICLSCEEEAVRLLARKGSDDNYGARPLRREIQRTVEDLLSEQLLSGTVKAGDTLVMRERNGEIVFDVSTCISLEKVEALTV